MAGWLAQLGPYRGWLVKGSAAGRWYGPAPHASRALRVPAGPAAPALDPRVPAGPGQGEAAGRAVPGPLVAWPRAAPRPGRLAAAGGAADSHFEGQRPATTTRSSAANPTDRNDR